MKRPGIGLVGVALVLVAAACTAEASPATTQTTAPPAIPSTTTLPTATTAASTTSTTAPTTTITTATLAGIPTPLPIVADPWEWEKLMDIEYTHEVRYDGTYLVYREPEMGAIVATRDGDIVVRHDPVDEQEWIIQDAELGDHWLAIVENTEAAGPDRSRLVVYDLATGTMSYEEILTEEDGLLSIPYISLSGHRMAIAGFEPYSNCVAIFDLVSVQQFDEICVGAPVFLVEIDGPFFGFDTTQPGCDSAWTGTLFGQDNDLREHLNRECWSIGPVGGDRITVWFESRPNQVGIDLIIGERDTGEAVSLGRGDNGTSEVCWNQAFWLTGDNDVRTWDGGDTVRTIFATDHPVYQLGCVGPWVTIATTEAIYTANVFTQSGADPCPDLALADAATETQLGDSLEGYVHDRFDDLPTDLEVSVGNAIGVDGWWIGGGGFSSNLEGAIFLWSPDRDVSLVWSGSADSEYDIRHYMLSSNRDAPPALLGCVDVDGYFG